MQVPFLKPSKKSKSSPSFSLPSLSQVIQAKSLKNRYETVTSHELLTKNDLSNFNIISVYDRKIIITFNSHLQLFGYFDLHAVHQRIRYEYYSSIIISQESKTPPTAKINPNIIQKQGKALKQVYGERKQVRVQLDLTIKPQSYPVSFKVWEIQCQKTNDRIAVTSFRPILGKIFSNDQLKSIVKESLHQKNNQMLSLPKPIDEWVAQHSCKNAYKFNDHLPLPIAAQIINNLKHCDFPWFCVHGRNTVHLTPTPTVKTDKTYIL